MLWTIYLWYGIWWLFSCLGLLVPFFYWFDYSLIIPGHTKVTRTEYGCFLSWCLPLLESKNLLYLKLNYICTFQVIFQYSFRLFSSRRLYHLGSVFKVLPGRWFFLYDFPKHIFYKVYFVLIYWINLFFNFVRIEKCWNN